MLLNQIYHSEIPLFLREFSATDALLRLEVNRYGLRL